MYLRPVLMMHLHRWGSNFDGQLGIGDSMATSDAPVRNSQDQSLLPTRVAGLRDVTIWGVAVGVAHVRCHATRLCFGALRILHSLPLPALLIQLHIMCRYLHRLLEVPCTHSDEMTRDNVVRAQIQFMRGEYQTQRFSP